MNQPSFFDLILGNYWIQISQPNMTQMDAEFLSAKPPFIHSHPTFELILSHPRTGAGNRVLLIPPFVEHRAYHHAQYPAADWIALSFEVHSLPAELPDSFHSGDAKLFEALLSCKEILRTMDSFGAWRCAADICEELSARCSGWYERCCAKLTILLTNIATCIPSASSGRAHSANSEHAGAIDIWFQQNYSDPNASAALLADTIHISERQLYRELQRIFGQSFRSILTKLRMSSAEEYRVDLHKKAEQIAELVGYSSTASFLRAYKEYYGKPFQYFK